MTWLYLQVIFQLSELCMLLYYTRSLWRIYQRNSMDSDVRRRGYFLSLHEITPSHRRCRFRLFGRQEHPSRLQYDTVYLHALKS